MDVADRRLAEALLAAYEKARRSVGIVEAFDAVAAEARRLLVRTPAVGDAVSRAMAYPHRSGRCRAGSDGDCDWPGCPQVRDGEPEKTGRPCPLLNEHKGGEA